MNIIKNICGRITNHKYRNIEYNHSTDDRVNKLYKKEVCKICKHTTVSIKYK